MTVENTHHNFHSFENRCNFFSRWKLLLVSASRALLLDFDNIFLRLIGKCDGTNHYANILQHEDIKACSWRQVRRLNFTGVLIVFYFPQTDLSELRSVAFCLWTISLSLSPTEGHFVVETRLAMIHVCTSNGNAYQERRVSYLRGIFDGLK